MKPGPRLRTIAATTVFFCGLTASVAQSQPAIKVPQRFSTIQIEKLADLLAQHGSPAVLSAAITSSLGLTTGSSSRLTLRQLGSKDSFCKHVFHILPDNGGYLLACINDDSASSYRLNAKQELVKGVVSRARGERPAPTPMAIMRKQLDTEIAFWINVIDRSCTGRGCR